MLIKICEKSLRKRGDIRKVEKRKMAILLGLGCLLMIIWILENQRAQKDDALSLTFRGSAGCEIEKRKNGKINMGVNIGGNLLSKKITHAGLLVIVILIMIGSVKTLKIEDEEGNILYDDKMDQRDGEVVEMDPGGSGIPQRILWNTMGFLGGRVRDWILSPPPAPRSPPPEPIKPELLKEIADISAEIQEMRDSMANIQVDVSVMKASDEEKDEKIDFTPEELEELMDPLGFLKKYKINPSEVGMEDYDPEEDKSMTEKRKGARREIIDGKKRDAQEEKDIGKVKKELISGITRKYVEILQALEKKIIDLNHQTTQTSEGCRTLKCCAKEIIEFLFDVCWMMLSDPMGFMVKAISQVTATIDGQFQTLRTLVGLGISFAMINGVIYALMKANEIYERGRKVVKTLLSLPLIKVGTKLIKGGTQLLLREEGKKGISPEEEKRLRKEEKEEMENRMDEKLKTMTEAMKKIREELKKVPRTDLQQKCSYCGSNVHTIKDCPFRMAEVNKECAYCGKRGHFAYDCLSRKQAEEKGMKPWQGMIGSWSNCKYCGRRGHKESECRDKQRHEALGKGAGPSNWQAPKPPFFPKPPKPPPRQTNTVDNRDPNGEKKRSVYAPIQLNGVKFSRCLIDTGSQVNLIPKADVTRNQFCGFEKWDKGDIWL